MIDFLSFTHCCNNFTENNRKLSFTVHAASYSFLQKDFQMLQILQELTQQ